MNKEITPDLIDRYRKFCNVSTLFVAILVACAGSLVALGNLAVINLSEWFQVFGSLNLAIVLVLFFWLFRLKLPNGFTRNEAVVAAMSDERVAVGRLIAYRNAFWAAVAIQLTWLMVQFSGSAIMLASATLVTSSLVFIGTFLWHDWE